MRKLKLIGFVALLLSASVVRCGSPTAPSAIEHVPSYLGVWRGEYLLTDCTGDRSCGPLLGATRSFVLRLQQSGTALVGIVVLDQDGRDNRYCGTDLTVDIAGSVTTADRIATLSGSKAALSDRDCTGDVEIRRLVLTPPNSGVLGTIDYESHYSASQHPETRRTTRSGQVVSLQQLAASLVNSVTPLDGRWIGRAMMRSCVSEAQFLFCEPNTGFKPLELLVTQSDSGRSFLLDGGVVSGSVSGQVLVLEGSGKIPTSGGFTEWRITEWSSTVDMFGRMRGSYSFSHDYHATVGVNAGRVYTSVAVYDLIDVVRMP